VAVVAGLADLRIKVKIGEWPNEVPDPIRFGEDRTHAAYDPEYARRFWRILLQVDRAFKLFRTGFIGKCSPVHFFWGSFDLAVTRFSGRPAPLHHLSDEVVREAYSLEQRRFLAGRGRRSNARSAKQGSHAQLHRSARTTGTGVVSRSRRSEYILVLALDKARPPR
jgi:hypothetical protein